MMPLHVFIPTRERVPRQISLKYFTPRVREKFPVTVVVPEFEKALWRAMPVDRVLTVPDNMTIGPIRQYISDMGGYQFTVDDDVDFFRRPDPVAPKLLKVTDDDMIEMLTRIETEWLPEYVHGGISAREGNNHMKTATKEVGRAMRALFYNSDIMNTEAVRWDAILIRMDFHVTLSLLELGYPNIVDYEFAQNQRGSAAAGGGSWYRTKEKFAEQAHVLAEMHPDFVRVEEKFTESAWGGGSRTDVTIQWKKAWCSREADRKMFR